tara:strand:+ start:182 stop:448 length:267 start_codon:yes stop_codon:yes gene_type:complete
MIKYFKLLFLLLFLNNCSAPGTAFFSPIITGVKTGSVYQASLSYSSNMMINKVVNFKNTINQKDPVIISSFAVIKVKISEVEEPEPLP